MFEITKKQKKKIAKAQFVSFKKRKYIYRFLRV